MTNVITGTTKIDTPDSTAPRAGSNQVVVFCGRLFQLIGVKDIHQGLYKEAYLNKDYLAAATASGKGLFKLVLSSAILAGVCFGAMKGKDGLSDLIAKKEPEDIVEVQTPEEMTGLLPPDWKHRPLWIGPPIGAVALFALCCLKRCCK